MAETEPLYLGFDLSTQQLKSLAVTSDLKVLYEAKFDFDVDSTGFDIKKGVLTNEEEGEVFAPISLWLQALDGVLQRLRDQGIDFNRVKGISGAGQQHGSVYWSEVGEKALQSLEKDKSLEEQLDQAFSYPFSPNWQDASTQNECDAFDQYLGGADELAHITGSKAHHVNSLPRIERDSRLILFFSALHWSPNTAI
jgi:xylulokinase